MSWVLGLRLMMETLLDWRKSMNINLTSELATILLQKKELEAREKELKELIKADMESCNVPKYEDDCLKIAYIPETESMTFDTKGFQKENPEAYKLFLKPTKKAAYLRVSVI